MKQKITKKLSIFALLLGILSSITVLTAQAKTSEKKEVWVADTRKQGSYQYKYEYNQDHRLSRWFALAL